MNARHALPIEVLEPIAAGTARCRALWEPLLGVARFHPVRLLGTEAYDVWLEAHPAGRDRADAAVSVAVVTGAGAFAVHVYSPARSSGRTGPAPQATGPATPVSGCPALAAAG